MEEKVIEKVKLNDMKLFQTVKTGGFGLFTRVPGGWVYDSTSEYGGMCFIPLSKEVGNEEYELK